MSKPQPANPTIAPAPTAPAEALPRPVTPRARRQSWWEPAVRAWWLAAAALAVAVLYFVGEQLTLSHVVRRRLSEWRHQVVTIDKIANSSRKTFTVEPDTLAITEILMSYTDAAGVKHELKGPLNGQLQARRPGDNVEVLINPADPSDFTDRIRPTPIVEQLIIPILLAPFPLAFAVVAIVKHRRTLALWRDGQRRKAAVVDVQKSAISPRSNVVRCTVPDSKERRLFRLAIPRRTMPDPRPNDPLDVITPPGEPTRAIAAMLYE